MKMKAAAAWGIGATISFHGVVLGHDGEDLEPAVVTHDSGKHTHEEDRAPFMVRAQQMFVSTSTGRVGARAARVPGGKVFINLEEPVVVYDLDDPPRLITLK